MDVGFHHPAQRGVDRAVPGQRRFARKGGTDDMHIEMPAPVARTGVPGMAMAVVLDLQQWRGECFLERRTDPFHSDRVHGSTFLNGRTSTRA